MKHDHDGMPSLSAFVSTIPKNNTRDRSPVFEELHPLLSPEAAYAESLRCLECGSQNSPAPCTVACPSDIDVPGFIKALAQSNPKWAAEIILHENPLGGTCARVCPTEELCEGACVLREAGRRPVAIGRLQRYAADTVLLSEKQDELLRVPPKPQHVAIIGAGPAGMACAAKLSQQGYQVTVYEARSEPGGLARFAIAPYRLWKTPLTEEMTRIARLGVTFRFNSPVKSQADLEAIKESADAIFLSVGLGNDIDSGYPGDHLPGVFTSLRFIEQIKTGNLPQIGRHVVVVGGGNTAIDVARESLLMGATDVTMIYRRTEKEMPAYRAEVEAALKEGVRFLWLTLPVRFLGPDRLTSVECRYARLGSPDESGRRYPEPIFGSEFELKADTAVLARGQQPRREWTQWIPEITMSGKRILVDPQTGQTPHPGVFAGGDAVNGGTTVVQAVREGKIAARGIQNFLEKFTGKKPEHSTVPSRSTLPSLPVPLSPIMVYKQQGEELLTVNRSWCKGCNVCVENCPTSILALDDNELIYVKDISQCIACGLCAVFCPDFVFSLNVPDPKSLHSLEAGEIQKNSKPADLG